MKHRVYAHELFLGFQNVNCLADVALVSVAGVLTDIEMLDIVIRILGRVGYDTGIIGAKAGPPCDDVRHVVMKLDVHRSALLYPFLDNYSVIRFLLPDTFRQTDLCVHDRGDV